MRKRRYCLGCGGIIAAGKAVGGDYCSDACALLAAALGRGGVHKKHTREAKAPEQPIRKELVEEMFRLPMDARWELGRLLTDEERKYAQKLGRRELRDDKWLDGFDYSRGADGEEEAATEFAEDEEADD